MNTETPKTVEVTDRVEFFYWTLPNEQRLTLAYKFRREDGIDKTFCDFAVAKCSLEDQFVKKIGRDKASGRLLSKTEVFTFEVGAPLMKPFVVALCNYINNAKLHRIEVLGQKWKNFNVIPTFDDKNGHEITFVRAV
jgi:hypothetical protein